MRILLDECMPRQLRRDLPGHDVRTVQELGCAGTGNGVLLQRAAAAGFEAFITVDRNLEFQQHIRGLSLAIIALRARSNDVVDLRPLMSAMIDALTTVSPGQVVRIPA